MTADAELARRTPAGIQIRPNPLRLRWELSELTTSDGHIARGTFTTTARALSEPNELKMLDEALLGSRTVLTTADVAAYFAEALLDAARKHAGSTDAQALLADAGRRALLDALLQSASAVAFGCGLEILQPAQIDLDCPTLARQRHEEIERQTAQRRAAGQLDSLRHSAELLAQFQSLRAAAPELSAGQILTQVSSADQADVLRAALQANTAGETVGTFHAVAGNNLVRMPREDAAAPEVIEVPGDLGPIRSIRPAADGYVLLGCRSGILHLHPDSPGDAAQYRDGESASQLGFNAAVIVGNTLWATHGEAGLIAWDLSEREKPRVAVRSLAARNLASLDSNRVALSGGSQLLIATGTDDLTRIETNSEIIAIFVQPQRILTVHADGNLCAWSIDDLKLESRSRRAGRICAATLLPWLDDSRILLATEDGPILCVGPDDDLITQYTSAYGPPRILTAATDKVAAVTQDRQRLIFWRPWDGRKPYKDIYLFPIARHRIADIVLI